MGMGGGGKTVQTSTQELSKEQRQLLEGVIPIAKDFLKSPPKQYEGSGIVGFNPLQTQAQQMTLDAANNIGQLTNGLPGQAQTAIQGLGQSANNAANAAGSVFSTLNPTMAFSAGQAGQTAGQVNNTINQGNAQTAGGLGFLTSGAVLDPNTNPYLQRATEAAIRPALDNFQNTILPGIKSDAISSGGYGGSRQGIAEGLAAQGLQRNIGDISSQIYSNAYGQGLGAMNQALGTSVNQTGQNVQGQLGAGQLTQQAANQILQAQLGGFGAQQGLLGQQANSLTAQMQGMTQIPQLAQSSLLPAQLTSAVGEQQQAMQQAQLTEQIQKYINQQLIPFSAAQDVAAMAFGIPGGSTTSNAQTTGGGTGVMPFLQGGLGIMSALPALFGMFSDRRLKKNIKKCGTLADGLEVYEYSFKDETQPRIGLMADEVFEKYPFAVMTDKSGYMTVRYDLVPSWEGEACFRS